MPSGVNRFPYLEEAIQAVPVGPEDEIDIAS